MNTQAKFTDSNNSTFSSIYSAYYRKMYAYGISIGFCQHICNDAIQDVFSSLLMSKKTIDNIENLETYLIRCMKNRLFDIYKNEKRKQTIDYEDITEDNEEIFIDKLIAEENRLMMEKEVKRLLKMLPSKHRKIIICRFNYNLKHDEIASIMNMTSDAVKKQLYRSLKLMGEEIKSTTTKYYNTC